MSNEYEIGSYVPAQPVEAVDVTDQMVHDALYARAGEWSVIQLFQDAEEAPDIMRIALRAGLRAALAHPRSTNAFDFAAHLQHQRDWSGKTFGPGSRAQGVVDHIRKELVEIEAAPADLKEWIDVVILALDGAWRSGAQPQEIIDALVAKQAKNESRVWPDWRTADPNKAIEHDRSHDVAGPTGEQAGEADVPVAWRSNNPDAIKAGQKYSDAENSTYFWSVLHHGHRWPAGVTLLYERAQPRPMGVPDDWLPIETAPKGEKVIAGYRNVLGNWRSIMACYYTAGTLELADDADDTDDGYAPEGWYEATEVYEEIRRTDEEPTHWMPLAAAPAPGKGGEA